ncbi:MAG: hypothetical protein ABSF74_03540 [Dehalococcoidia bacterium]|jgi:hypothetical protein
MNFRFGEKEELLRDRVRKFAVDKLSPKADESDEVRIAGNVFR